MEMVNRLTEEFSKAEIFCTTDIEKNIIGKFDPLRLEQVIDNLLTNAIKYAPGKPIFVSLKRHQAFARFVVEDHGQGIPCEKQEKIFDRFERATNSSHISGLGLGLFIAKEIVQGHSGSIHLESVVGGGSKFIVDLPLDNRTKKVKKSNVREGIENLI